MDSSEQLQYHENTEPFREAINFTESNTGFSARLIEKDYYCSLVLRGMAEAFQQGLIFKGGTCLSKVHSDFYRLSEDLDFVFSMETNASISVRRTRIAQLKDLFTDLPKQLPCFRVDAPLSGFNSSKQYIGRLSYNSVVTGRVEFLKIEVGLREPVLDSVEHRSAQTMLTDPLRVGPVLESISVTVLSFRETYAEKFRAAITRRDPAIRDYYDIDYAIRSGKLNPSDDKLLGLLRHKLAVPGNEPVDVSNERFTALQRQVEPQLKPVLRTHDFEHFDLERAFEIVANLVGKL
jgi:predicted nucleotidyltransferase component of viral defense system